MHGLIPVIRTFSILLLLLVILLRVGSQFEGVLLPDMRRFTFKAYYGSDTQHSEKTDKEMNWHFNRIQTNLEAKRPFFLTIQSDRALVGGDKLVAAANFPFSGDLACMSVFAHVDKLQEAEEYPTVFVTVSANEGKERTSFNRLNRPRRIDIHDILPRNGGIDVSFALEISDDSKKPLPGNLSRVVFDYLYIRDCS